MEIIFGPRQSGKTIELIKRSHSSRAVIVTATQERAVAVKQMAKELQIDIPDPICIYSLMHQKRSWGILNNGHIQIDDADAVLKSICAGYEIDAITMTNPNIGNTVTYTYETYQLDVERAEVNQAVRNDILEKRFGIPMDGYTD